MTLLSRVAAAGEPRGAQVAAGAPDRPVAPVPALQGPDEIAAYILDPDGLGLNYGDRFLPRREQAELAAAVARALEDDQALLAEAGTGTGKTLAYLVPLLALLQAGGDRAVISTYSRTLQQQILQGDLPRLLASDHDVGARLLMGRGNYLCLRQRTGYLTRPLESGREALKTVALRLWLRATEDGLREELASHPLLAEDTAQLFSAVQPCTPQCHDDTRCFVARARRLARRARLVVVNHALLLHDHAADHALVGPYQRLVVDEAHRLPAAALDARSVGLHRGRLLDLEQVVGVARAGGKPAGVCALLAQLAGDGARPRRRPTPRPPSARPARRLRHFAAWWRRAGTEAGPATRGARPAGAGPGQGRRLQRPCDRDPGLLEASLAEAAGAAANLAQRTEDLDDRPAARTDLLLRCAQGGSCCGSWTGRAVRDHRSRPTAGSPGWIPASGAA